jgi:hypothetical protein
MMRRPAGGIRGRGPSTIARAIDAVGELLARDGETAGIVIVGGAAMILQGWAARLTEDVDVIAITEGGADGTASRLRRADPLPQPLLKAISRVARDFNLSEDWMNSMVTAQWDLGLPPGFEQRIRWERHGGLILGLAGRLDMIFLKLYAAVDSEGPQSVHVQDLLALRPDQAELEAAAQWLKAQDPSPEFARLLQEVLDHVGQNR